ncbi:MAG: hypothetical protein AAF354_13820 [Pseudomonadota bacterium]
MANNQDTGRPQDLGGVGHLSRTARGKLAPIVGLAFGVMCAVVALPGPAFAQDIGLRRGEASLNSGQFTEAARQLSSTVNHKNATLNQVARALYLRGIAYRRAGYPGQAASDLGAALWLGLPSSDKARAYVNKGLAFQAAGMESQGASAMAQARRYSSASTVQKLIAQDGGVGPVASAGIASYIPDASGLWDSMVPSFGTPKTASPGAAAPAEDGSMWDRIVPSFGAPKAATESATAPAAEGATAAASPQAAPTSGWDASVSEGSGGNAVSRWWDSVSGGGGTAPQAAPAPTVQSAPAANSTTATARSPAPVPAPAQPQAAPTTGWDTSVSEGEGGNAVSRWWDSVSGSGQ